MIRDEIDPSILDLDPEQSLAIQQPPSDKIHSTDIDPKYLKMIEVVRSVPSLLRTGS